MTIPQRFLNAIIDPTGRYGRDRPCAIGGTEASSGRGNSRSDARHPRLRRHDRRDSIISIRSRRSAVTGARPGGANSP